MITRRAFLSRAQNITTPTRRKASTRPGRSAGPSRLTPGRPRSSPSADPDAAIHAATKQTIRRIVLTGAVALVTVVGAITGARLKSDRDVVKHRQEVQELPLEERVAMLEIRRSELVGMKLPLERKLVGLRERMEAEKKQQQQQQQQQAAAAAAMAEGKA